MPVSLQFDQIDDAFDRLAVLDFGAPDAGQKQHLGERIGGDAGVTAGQQVFQHAHLREQLAVLERAREAEPRDLVRRTAGDVLALEPDGAARRDRCR